MRRVYNEVLDDYLSLPDRVERIISLDPAATETLFMLGFGEKVIATDAFSYRPSEAKRKLKIGSYTHVNLNLLEELKPDIVFTTMGAQKELTRKLIDRNFNVYPLGVATSVSRILNNVILVSLVVNAHNVGRELYQSLLLYLMGYRRLTNKRPKIYVEFDLGGPISCGYATHVSDAINLVGGENIFDDISDAYFTPNDNDVIERNPDLIVYEPKRLTDYEKERILNYIEKRGLGKFKEKVVFTVGDFLAHQGPSFITDGVKFLHSVIPC
ncbi:ABC transporter substrate-binding protein [Sulfolobus acidocaldarius]|uniref:Vitamin B12 transport protein n=4 Tax=Sulfolobus acidocaldarius TaxID=2285 RepID=Q4J6H3_SULAC|nr:ABC transporter substrate-binding protein [Sulfolobus acidocaldarius]AAY81608.1 vitamin B12 transport protein [Sulfolobus acidocaldarius DSM 639]AGE72211.1 vitamin B12 transport protein [Sulfolobus acidocaldarius N8]AGE74528.1 vitamin B12 transport protein [Sulfolobus acidocaldarius Ron12/I]ALU29621.1 iron ABC transporter substrate-binding protein [Sulfolobus acidocaldarius]ALU32354.1 iron ABC transporter substrate-binding protein [Sulfolobus acidocaldarius]